MRFLPYVLIALGWPVTSLIVNYIRHRPKYLEPGVGTQHIRLAGFFVQAVLIGSGIGLLFARVL